jgi:iron complex outermembrane receptor protein
MRTTESSVLKSGATAAFTLCAGIALTTHAAAQDSKPTGGDKDAELEMVVVTAQFRSQNIQDTPLAITAITADMLEARSETNIVDVAAHAPNVRLTPGSAPFGPVQRSRCSAKPCGGIAR